MPTAAQLPFHVALFVTTVTAVAIARAALNPYHTNQRQGFERKAVETRVRTTSEAWRKLHYTEGGAQALAEILLQQVKLSNYSTSPIQEQELRSEITAAMEHLVNPDYDTYCRLKTNALSAELKLSPIALHLLIRSGASTNIPNGSFERLYALWHRCMVGRSNAMSHAITAISPERVRAAMRRENGVNVITRGETANGFTFLMEAIEPGFFYQGSTKAVSAEDAEGLFFHLSFFARPSGSTNAGPVYMSLYWSDADQKWAMSRLFYDRSMKFQTMF